MIEFHLLFHENISLAKAHEQATLIEQEIYKQFPQEVEVISHLEPAEGHDEFHKKVLRNTPDS